MIVKAFFCILVALSFTHVNTRGKYFLVETKGNDITDDIGEKEDNEFEDMKNEAEAQSAGKDEIGGGEIMTWTEYHPLEIIDAYMNYLTKTFPDWVSTEVIGNSYERRSMHVLKVCRGGCGASAEASKPAIWIDGGIHAREWISPAVVTYMMMELVEHDSKHPHLTKELDWYFLPNANPDGYVYTTCGGEMSVDCPSRFWRKTRSCDPEDKNPESETAHKSDEGEEDKCEGADPNRNWDILWDSGQESSTNSSGETYRGTGPFSEVETRNIRDFLWKQKNYIKLVDSIHSSGRLILFPNGFSECENGDCIKKPDNIDALIELAKLGNAALKAEGGEEFEMITCRCAQNLTSKSGLAIDWAKTVAKIPFTFTLELPPARSVEGLMKFHLREDKIIPTGKEVWAFHCAVAEKIIKG